MNPRSKAYLKKILSQANKSTLAVFDLDSTLFDVSPRIHKILTDFGKTPENLRQFPEVCSILTNIKMERKDWGIKDALLRAGLDGHNPSFHQAIKEYWQRTFFSNEYLKYDRPYEGSVDYVQRFYSTGAAITYLTGRDVARMGTGSVEILKHWGFPLDEEGPLQRASLVLKPRKGMDDARYKSDFFCQNLKNLFSKIWFFENEPVNISLVRQEHPEVEVIFFDSAHSGKLQTPSDLPSIIHYLLD